MGWYDTLDHQHSVEQAEHEAQEHASGKGALALVQQLYQERQTMKPDEFIVEITRLAFQSGASDLHFQAEKRGIVMRVRVDGIMQEVLIFEHSQFAQYIAKIKFMSGIKVNV